MNISVSANDPRLEWAGAPHLHRDNNCVIPLRCDPAEDLLFHEGLRDKLHCPAGIRIRFSTTATHIKGTLNRALTAKPVACTCDGQILASAPLTDSDHFIFTELPSGSKTLELWLPQTCPDFGLCALELDADITPAPNGGPRWVHYGSSISQCAAAQTPAETWPGTAARLGGLDLTCFGLGGQCHLDPMLARAIRNRKANAISLKLGINICGQSSLNARTFGPGICGFVTLLRERHPTIPIVLISPIFCPHRETNDNAVGMNLEKMRVAVEQAATDLRACGDRAIHSLSGLELFSSDDAHLLPDNLHPNHEGYQLMGQRFHDKVTQRFFI
ncbi:MAG: GDSL-type esterase/lipase family protein [Planctomycetota bacterium]|jgi:hypothetical protein|nr:GDSL-type esterase/lipase family protein [Planctomycetota bacterium]